LSRNPLVPPSPSDKEYAAAAAANEAPLPGGGDPFALFGDWFAEARKKEPGDANAMALATVDAVGAPDARMVLMKDFDAAGFVFYTNLDSAKGAQLAANPQCALLFYWKSLRRQVRLRGAAAPVSAAEADEYFASRARDARIGAWASDQSRPLEGRFALEKRVAMFAAKFALGEVPRPPHWGGFRLAPLSFEFWRDRPFRLHDRLAFTRADVNAPWFSRRLFP
jgi:pyridoxamine 5'-phosphate oxidase